MPGAVAGIAREFVAAVDNDNPWRTTHGDMAVPPAQCQGQLRRTEPRPFGQQDRALGKVHPAAADMLAGGIGRRAGQRQALTLAGRVFLHQHHVGAFGHQRSGGDPHRLAGT